MSRMKAYQTTGKRVWFLADTHFGHAKMIDMAARPFKTASEMDSRMIEAWNIFVRPEDEIFFVGDFAYGDRPYKLSIFNRLMGRKHLISGNHDDENTLSLCWESVSEMKTIVVDKQRILLCHYPMREWPGFWGDTIHFYGHVHGNLPGSLRTYDVGVDSIGWAPQDLTGLRKLMAPLPDLEFKTGQPFVRDRDRKDNDEGLKI